MSLVIAEAALETVPKGVAGHVSVKRHAQKLGKKSSEILLDRSYHHAAMKGGKLDSDWKRGRPDIAHFALMSALSTPLFLKGILKVYVHTINDKVIFISDNLRIPKSYFRFEGLMMDLFKNKVAKSDDDKILLELHDDINFETLVKKIIKPDRLIGLSTNGVETTVEKVAKQVSDSDHCTFVIGGFPKGHFSENVSMLLNSTYSISGIGLEAHVVISRLIYECEKAILLEY